MFSLQIKMAGVCVKKSFRSPRVYLARPAQNKIMMTRRSLTEQKKLKINNAVMANSRKKKGKEEERDKRSASLNSIVMPFFLAERKEKKKNNNKNKNKLELT